MDNSEAYYNCCTSAFLYNTLQNYGDKVVFIDTRDNEYYNKYHIKGSILINKERLLQNFRDEQEISLERLCTILDDWEKKKFSYRRRFFWIIITSENSLSDNFVSCVSKKSKFDSEGDDYFQISDAAMTNSLTDIDDKSDLVSFKWSCKIARLLISDRVRESYILVEGANNTHSKYPFLFEEQSQDHQEVSIKRFPNEIWDSRLYLGCFVLAEEWQIIKYLKITHILNVTSECENVYEEKGIVYMKLNISDEDDQLISKFFKEAFEFIDRALESNKDNTILIHCARGMSRSVTITVMFLMKKFQWNLKKALNYVKKRRSIANPNYGFLKQLEEFEESGFKF